MKAQEWDAIKDDIHGSGRIQELLADLASVERERDKLLIAIESWKVEEKDWREEIEEEHEARMVAESTLSRLREACVDVLAVLEIGIHPGLHDMGTLDGRAAWIDRMKPVRERIRAALIDEPKEAQPADCLCSTWVGKPNPKCPVHDSLIDEPKESKE
jgi:hypothetical protein